MVPEIPARSSQGAGEARDRETESSSVPILFDEALQERMWAISEHLPDLTAAHRISVVRFILRCLVPPDLDP